MVGRVRAAGSGDARCRPADPTTGLTTATLTGHTSSVTAVAWPPDGTRLATTSNIRTGSVLVTARWSGGDRSAEQLRVGVLARDEVVQFLARRTGRTDPEGFANLPLALEEAAAYLEQTGIGPNEYLAGAGPVDRADAGPCLRTGRLASSESTQRGNAR